MSGTFSCPKRVFSSALFIGGLFFAACAPASEGRAERQASTSHSGPYLRSIDGWTSVDRDTLVVYSGRQPWRVDVMGNCSELVFADAIAIDTRGTPGQLSSSNFSTIYVDGRPCGVKQVSLLPKDFDLKTLRAQERAERDAARQARIDEKKDR